MADLVWMITASDVLLLMLSHPSYLTEVALIEALVVILVQENVMAGQTAMLFPAAFCLWRHQGAALKVI